jgi:ADP-ribose pyrophosphatase
MEVLLKTSRFRVVRSAEQLPDGSSRTREFVEHPGSVTILPLVDDQHVCLIENYRLAVGNALVELPAGTLEPGEDPLQAARRELAEETGYRAGSIQPLCAFYLSPGILQEQMHLYLATDLTPGPTQLDAGEQITSRVVPWSDAIRMTRDGSIQDAKTLLGLLYYDHLRQRTAEEGRM